MAKSPQRVSIVIPTFNRASLLGEAIDSLLAQDYEPLEVLVLDDGSTDETPDLLHDYSARDPARLRWSRHENMGQARTLNRGFEMASGELLGYLSSDDVLLPGAIARLASELEAHPDAVLAYPAFKVADAELRPFDVFWPGDYSLQAAILDQHAVIGVGPLFRATAARRAGGWNPRYRYMADWEFWIRLALIGPFRYVAQPLGIHRVHDGSITAAERSLRVARERLDALEDLFASETDLPLEIRASWGRAVRAALAVSVLCVDPEHPSSEDRFTLVDRSGPEHSQRANDAVEQRTARLTEVKRRQRETIATLRARLEERGAKIERLRTRLDRLTARGPRPRAR